MSRKPTRRERRAGWTRHEPPPPVDRPIVRSEHALRLEAEALAREAERKRQREAMTPAQRDAERARDRVSSLLMAGLVMPALALGAGRGRR